MKGHEEEEAGSTVIVNQDGDTVIVKREVLDAELDNLEEEGVEELDTSNMTHQIVRIFIGSPT